MIEDDLVGAKKNTQIYGVSLKSGGMRFLFYLLLSKRDYVPLLYSHAYPGSS
jgi:hypothetical protein